MDYGTDKVSTIVVNADTGENVAMSEMEYPRWKQGLYCNAKINQWRHHPLDYIEVLEGSIKDVLSFCAPNVVNNIVAIGIDTTGSTPVFVDKTATPLSLYPEFSENPNAMLLLWKDHTSIAEATEITEACKAADVDYTKYVGGTYSAEWFWAKAIHVLRNDEAVTSKAQAIIECCEWLPAMLTGVTDIKQVIHSRCALGHKAMWHEEWNGMPPESFLLGLEPKLSNIMDKFSGKVLTADKSVGIISPEWSQRLGLPGNVRIAGGAYNSHLGAVGAGVIENTMVTLLGKSTCNIMIASKEKIGDKCIDGICGQVDGSVIPGMIGLEAGQSSYGDVYEMFTRLMRFPLDKMIIPTLKDYLPEEQLNKIVDEACMNTISKLCEEAEKLPLSENDMVATDWFNGRRSPNANSFLKGTITGYELSTSAPQIFKALVEGTAFGAKAIIEKFETQDIPVNDVIIVGRYTMKSSFIIQTLCDIINKPVKVINSDYVCSLGSAMIAATAAGVYEKVEKAIEAMNAGFSRQLMPIAENTAVYNELYKTYTRLGKFTEDYIYNKKLN